MDASTADAPISFDYDGNAVFQALAAPPSASSDYPNLFLTQGWGAGLFSNNGVFRGTNDRPIVILPADEWRALGVVAYPPLPASAKRGDIVLATAWARRLRASPMPVTISGIADLQVVLRFDESNPRIPPGSPLTNAHIKALEVLDGRSYACDRKPLARVFQDLNAIAPLGGGRPGYANLQFSAHAYLLEMPVTVDVSASPLPLILDAIAVSLGECSWDWSASDATHASVRFDFLNGVNDVHFPCLPENQARTTRASLRGESSGVESPARRANHADEPVSPPDEKTTRWRHD